MSAAEPEEPRKRRLSMTSAGTSKGEGRVISKTKTVDFFPHPLHVMVPSEVSGASSGSDEVRPQARHSWRNTIVKRKRCF